MAKKFAFLCTSMFILADGDYKTNKKLPKDDKNLSGVLILLALDYWMRCIEEKEYINSFFTGKLFSFAEK